MEKQNKTQRQKFGKNQGIIKKKSLKKLRIRQDYGR